MRQRTRLSVGALLTMALVLTGLVLRRREVLALALPLLVYTGALALAGLWTVGPRLVVSRRLESHRLQEDTPLQVTLTIRNEGRSVPFLGCTDLVPASVGVIDGQRSCLSPLAAGETASISYAVRPARGEHVFRCASVICFGPLALPGSELELPCEDRVFVLPHVENLEEIDIRPRQTRVYSGTVRANLGGVGTDFFGCRDYAPGDDVRRINWRVYARRDTLVVNEHEQERIADVSVILDARERANLRLGEPGPFTYCVRAAASLAVHFLAAGNHVGLLIYGDLLDWTYPGYGRTQRERILDALARANPVDKVVFEDLRHIPTRLFPPRSQLVVVSPLCDQDDVEVLGTLRARGYQIILVSPNPFTLALATPTPEHALALRILRLRRALLLSTLAGIGVQVVDWDLNQPLAWPVAHLLSRHGRRGR